MADIYLAARYSRREELCEYAAQLRDMGHTVKSRWLLGTHQLHPNPEGVDAEVKSVPPEARPFAQDDWDDLLAADWCVAFSEPANSKDGGRGGRHVEFGLALAWEKRVIVVGPCENVFHRLPQVEVYPSWPTFVTAVTFRRLT